MVLDKIRSPPGPHRHANLPLLPDFHHAYDVILKRVGPDVQAWSRSFSVSGFRARGRSVDRLDP